MPNIKTQFKYIYIYIYINSQLKKKKTILLVPEVYPVCAIGPLNLKNELY